MMVYEIYARFVSAAGTAAGPLSHWRMTIIAETEQLARKRCADLNKVLYDGSSQMYWVVDFVSIEHLCWNNLTSPAAGQAHKQEGYLVLFEKSLTKQQYDVMTGRDTTTPTPIQPRRLELQQ